MFFYNILLMLILTLACLINSCIGQVVYDLFDQPARTNSSKCAKIKEITKNLQPEEISHRHYMILEDCLYYVLSDKADKIANMTKSFSEFSPNAGSTRKLDITLDGLVLKDFEKRYYNVDIRLSAAVNMSWQDSRLMWNPQEWNGMTSMKIKLAKDIWLPPLKSETAPLSMVYLFTETNYDDIQNIRVDNSGHVTVILYFQMSPQCETDYRNYPLNALSCCVKLDFPKMDKTIRYKISNHFGTVPKLNKFQWSVSDLKLDWSKMVNGNQNNDDDDEKILNVCLKAVRYSRTENVKLVLPMVISALLVIVAPFFGTMPKQIYAKMFALLLQFLCFQYLGDPLSFTRDMFHESVLPKMFIFYELTIGTSLTSLLITLILNMLSKKQQKLPLSRKLKIFANIMTKIVCWSVSENFVVDQEKQHDSLHNDQQNSEWKQFLIAINDTASLLVIVIYVIGALATVL